MATAPARIVLTLTPLPFFFSFSRSMNYTSALFFSFFQLNEYVTNPATFALPGTLVYRAADPHHRAIVITSRSSTVLSYHFFFYAHKIHHYGSMAVLLTHTVPLQLLKFVVLQVHLVVRLLGGLSAF